MVPLSVSHNRIMGKILWFDVALDARGRDARSHEKILT